MNVSVCLEHLGGREGGKAGWRAGRQADGCRTYGGRRTDYCCYASYLLLLNVYILNLNYSFEFRS